MQQFKNLIFYGLGAATVITIIMLTSYTRPDSSGQASASAPTTTATTTAAPKPNTVAQEVYAPEMPDEEAQIQPPYPSSNHYDAKVWRFVLESALSGALVWNVG